MAPKKSKKASAKPKAIPKALQNKVKKWNADKKKLDKLGGEIAKDAKKVGYSVRYK